jgi:uncharacterized protein YndB with AHSA1/START domain
MAKFIQHQLFYPHPPEIVWEYLTDPELMALWLMRSEFRPIVGHEFQFRTKPVADLNFDGVFYCKVLEVVPFKRLSYSWRFGPGDGRPLNNSIVNWTLAEKDNGTELLLVHNGFEKEAYILPIFGSMEEGWLRNMQKIEQLLNSTTNGTAPA